MSAISKMTYKKKRKDIEQLRRDRHIWETLQESLSIQKKESCTWELSNLFRSSIYSWRLARDYATLLLERSFGLTHPEPHVLQGHKHEAIQQGVTHETKRMVKRRPSTFVFLHSNSKLYLISMRINERILLLFKRGEDICPNLLCQDQIVIFNCAGPRGK